MYTKIPKSWRTFDGNVTLEELNDRLVELHVPTIVFLCILMVIGVFGNILVLYIYSTKYHSSTYRCFILWLGWIDLTACTVGMPLLIVSMLYPYMFPSESACKIFRSLHVFFVVASAFVVIAIAIERHRRVCTAFSTEMSIRKIKIMCLIATILGLIVAVPAFWLYGEADVATGVQNITGRECFIDPDYENTSFPKLYFLTQLLLTLICMLILGVFYTRICRKIYTHHRFIRENTYMGNCSTAGNNKGKKNSTNGVLSDSEFNNPVCHSGVERSTTLPPSSTKKSSPNRELTPPQEEVDQVAHKEDPYGDLKKKSVTLLEKKSRSSSPNSQKSTPETVRREKAQRNRLESSQSAQSSSSRQGPSLRTRQVTMMLFTITVVFVLSFIPHLVLMVMNSMSPEFLDDMSPATVAVYNLFLRTFVINNMANPIIYGFLDRKFRMECRELFTCQQCR